MQHNKADLLSRVVTFVLVTEPSLAKALEKAERHGRIHKQFVEVDRAIDRLLSSPHCSRYERNRAVAK